MSIHASRPEPPKPAVRAVIVDPPHTAAPPAPPRPPAIDDEPSATPTVAAPAAPRVEAPAAAEPHRPRPASTAGAWYRREPWAAAMALAALCVAAALVAPQGAVYPLIGVGGACLLVGLALLVRGGVPPRGEL